MNENSSFIIGSFKYAVVAQLVEHVHGKEVVGARNAK